MGHTYCVNCYDINRNWFECILDNELFSYRTTILVDLLFSKLTFIIKGNIAIYESSIPTQGQKIYIFLSFHRNLIQNSSVIFKRSYSSFSSCLSMNLERNVLHVLNCIFDVSQDNY